jgi:predicted transcriptional regulator
MNPGIIVEAIADELDVTYVTLAWHVAKLHDAPLIEKKYQGTF